ncbi:ABC transporter substrate-binding protein [Paenibacillus pectinilyticus]|uniref:ABC transporter substrate-binding protein n=1 Tax=Paenibacillus pectinilyticus TaxID=512399 RepID=A0A1C0ZUS7_9BACL|nr:ABC transporter substrate-binding protein [Paenibacillus pectinilyticus]OCT11859.1 ABC transporter substrate-binding protein [Paenibacillus pectinilyticus]
MRKQTKIITMSLATMMVTTLFLTACGKDTGDQKTASTSSASPSASSTVNADTKTPADLTLAFPIFGAMPKNMNLIQDEVNKITQTKINATVKLLPISFGNWNQQTNLMMSSNEKLDLMLILGTYTNQVAKGQLLPLDDLITKYGKGITTAVGADYLNVSKVEGKNYGVPSIREFARGFGFTMRKDIADKNNIDVSKIKTLDDVESVLKIIKEKEPNLTPIAPGGSNSTFMQTYIPYDGLGDAYGVLPNYDNGLKIVNNVESPEYAAYIKKFRSWYTSGYVLKDAATNQMSSNDLVKAGKLFGYLTPTKPGFDSMTSRQTTYQMVTATLIDPVATTFTTTGIMWGIPHHSTNPDRAMMLLNLLYTDKDLINLLDWGIEGKHYVKVSDNLIDFPQGIDANTSGYYMGLSWMWGNQFLSYVFKGDSPDIWKETMEFNKSAKKSKALGFSFDADPVKTEITAVTNVTNQYQKGIETGTLDPDKALPEYISKLKAAGIDKIIAEKQKQMDAWAKTTK